ncbi:hypothetical protein QR680_002943 [Steinernema hermaphroditum]|uniref:Uncharacterized protein n=1 Tax=Steinernema hermaphroditum TaxID=289476 RepID=A0AA39LJ48_9BILA|nr:hypothetical protein QR680_002943 [Steinernema hermaphroditum]
MSEDVAAEDGRASPPLTRNMIDCNDLKKRSGQLDSGRLHNSCVENGHAESGTSSLLSSCELTNHPPVENGVKNETPTSDPSQKGSSNHLENGSLENGHPELYQIVQHSEPGSSQHAVVSGDVVEICANGENYRTPNSSPVLDENRGRSHSPTRGATGRDGAKDQESRKRKAISCPPLRRFRLYCNGGVYPYLVLGERERVESPPMPTVAGPSAANVAEVSIPPESVPSVPSESFLPTSPENVLTAPLESLLSTPPESVSAVPISDTSDSPFEPRHETEHRLDETMMTWVNAEFGDPENFDDLNKFVHKGSDLFERELEESEEASDDQTVPDGSDAEFNREHVVPESQENGNDGSSSEGEDEVPEPQQEANNGATEDEQHPGPSEEFFFDAEEGSDLDERSYSIEDSPASPDPPDEGQMDDGEIELLERVEEIMSNDGQENGESRDSADDDSEVVIHVQVQRRDSRDLPPAKFNELARSDTDDPLTMVGVIKEHMKGKTTRTYTWNTLENIATHIIEERERQQGIRPQLTERKRQVKFHDSVKLKLFTKWYKDGRKIPLSSSKSTMHEIPLIDHVYEGPRLVTRIEDKLKAAAENGMPVTENNQYDSNGASAGVKELLGRHLRNRNKGDSSNSGTTTNSTISTGFEDSDDEGQDDDMDDYDDDDDYDEEQDEMSDGVSTAQLNIYQQQGNSMVAPVYPWQENGAGERQLTDEMGYPIDDPLNSFALDERNRADQETLRELKRLRRKRKLDAETSPLPCCSKSLCVQRPPLLPTPMPMPMPMPIPMPTPMLTPTVNPAPPQFALPLLTTPRMAARVSFPEPNNDGQNEQTIDQIRARVRALLNANSSVNPTTVMARVGERLLQDLHSGQIPNPFIEYSSSYTDASLPSVSAPNPPLTPPPVTPVAAPQDPSTISLYDPPPKHVSDDDDDDDDEKPLE